MNINNGLQLTNLNDMYKFAKLIAESQLVPMAYRHKPEDILLAIQMGAEIGITPVASLTGIKVINGIATMWGDPLLGLVLAHPECEYVNEYFDDQTQTAFCEVKRKNHPLYVQTFSKKDAEKALLWNKKGPWVDYPNRMLQMRARGFALRDKFADALHGLKTVEEVNDYSSEEINDYSSNNNYNTTNNTNFKKIQSESGDVESLSLNTKHYVEKDINVIDTTSHTISTLSSDQLTELTKEIELRDVDLIKFLEYYDISSLDQLPLKDFEEALQKIKLKKPIKEIKKVNSHE